MDWKGIKVTVRLSVVNRVVRLVVYIFVLIFDINIINVLFFFANNILHAVFFFEHKCIGHSHHRSHSIFLDHEGVKGTPKRQKEGQEY